MVSVSVYQRIGTSLAVLPLATAERTKKRVSIGTCIITRTMVLSQFPMSAHPGSGHQPEHAIHMVNRSEVDPRSETATSRKSSWHSSNEPADVPIVEPMDDQDASSGSLQSTSSPNKPTSKKSRPRPPAASQPAAQAASQPASQPAAASQPASQPASSPSS